MGLGCVTMWYGDRLGPIERACLRSVSKHHPVALYCYGALEGVPDEVEIRDASEILSYEAVTAPWCARADLYSDWFRYELLRRGLGTWVDTDIYLLAPLDLTSAHLFGFEAPSRLNSAVFRVPPESPLLTGLLEPFHKRTTPRWLPWHSYAPRRLREILTGKVDLLTVPWGTTSPTALTGLARKLRLTHLAQPRERFYPMPWQQAHWIRDPGKELSDVTGEDTVAVHLWNYCISSFKNEPAPEGSFLQRLQLEGS